MKILLIINQLEFGGAERQLLYLVKGLIDKEFQVIVSSLTPQGAMLPEFLACGAKVVNIRKNLPRMDITRVIQLRRLIRQINPDIVHSFMFTANFYTSLAGCFLKIPIIVSERNANPIKKSIQSLLESYFIPRATEVICNSSEGAKLLLMRGIASPKSLSVVPNGIDLSRFSSHSSIRNVRKALGLENDVFLLVRQ